MEHLKKKKSFSWRDLLYKSLLFVSTVTLIVYFLPRDGKFNYQFDINKPWKYGQLIATFDFPIYKEDAVVKREQDSLMAFFQPYYQLDKNIEKDAIAKLKENYHTNLKGILPSIDYLRYIERTLKEIYQAGIVSTENIQQLQKDSTSSVMVIVDEEHENTYKQQDPAPRYHARSAAIVLAAMYGAKTLLGTATPSIESWQNAGEGKYGFVQLKERYKEIQLPEIIPVDIKELHRKKRMVGQFSPLLIQYMKEALEQEEQVILFQNRRGFAPMVECRTCGWVPKCKNCDVSLTYHKGINQLTCHYCGYTYQLPKSCPACEGTELVNRGFGTEKIEDDIKILFPEAAVARMDLDTTRTRSAYEKIIADFEQGKTDILIGTQMVSKGLDFDHVSIVGILNADTMLNYPDFRSYERAFQLMAQVAGRAGRKNKRGRVVLQTKSIEHPIIHQVIANDYEDMVGGQLAERQMFHYPPYYRLVYVYLKNHNEALLDQMATVMADKLRAVFGNRVLGPDKPPVARIQTLFIKKIVVKIEQNAPMGRARELLLRIQREMLEDERYKSLIVYYDVDPM